MKKKKRKKKRCNNDDYSKYKMRNAPLMDVVMNLRDI